MKRTAIEDTPEEAQLVAPPLERQTYTVEEAAKILGICRAVAYRKGVLPTVKIAGRRLVPKAALDRMLAKTA
jgi:excisionase family DNA binding protein